MEQEDVRKEHEHAREELGGVPKEQLSDRKELGHVPKEQRHARKEQTDTRKEQPDAGLEQVNAHSNHITLCFVPLAYMLRHFIICLLFPLAMGSCTFEKANPPELGFQCDSATYTYDDDIVPIMAQSCNGTGVGSGCHDTWIFNYNSVLTEINQIEMRVLEIRDMPPRENQHNIPPLTDEELRTFKCWIENGTPEN